MHETDPPSIERDKWFWNGLTNQLPTGPSAYNSEHVYYFYFEGTGNSEVFMFQDEGGYGDNSGSLSIEIWEREIQIKKQKQTIIPLVLMDRMITYTLEIFWMLEHLHFRMECG